MALDKARIVEVAMELLAESGLDGVTMRALGARLGIKGATLYHHFANKRDLLDHMAERMLRDGWRAPSPGQSWQDWLRDGARAMRAAMLSYRDGARLSAGAYPTEGYGMQIAEMLLEPLMKAGFPPEEALGAIFTMGRYTLGWTLDEQAVEEGARSGDRVMRDTHFQFGLDLILSGLEQRLATR